MGLVAKVSPASGSRPCRPGSEPCPAAPATPSAEDSQPAPARTQPGPDPTGQDQDTSHLSPPSLPVLLATGTQQGAGCQVRRRGSCPGQIHDQPSVLGCPRLLPPPPPTSPPSGPCAAATSANLRCVIASSGRRWEGVGEEKESGGGKGRGRRQRAGTRGEDQTQELSNHWPTPGAQAQGCRQGRVAGI